MSQGIRLGRASLLASIATLSAALFLASPSWAYHVLNSGGDSPAARLWFAGLSDLNTGEAIVPVESDPGDPPVAYLNVAFDFDGNSVYAPYAGTGGTQDEWVVQNVPIDVSFPGDYESAYFSVTDAIAKSGSHPVEIWVTSAPLPAPVPGTGIFNTLLSMGTYDEFQFGTPSTQGPSGSPGSSDRMEGSHPAGGSSFSRPAAATSSPTRALPDRQQQIDSECFITSVAMSMKWLAATYPNMFKAALPAIADLITAMKNTDEWKTYNIIRWGHLFEWKQTIFNQYKAAVVIHQWNGTDDAYTWMKNELDHGEDVEMSMGYKPVADGDGHTVILTGWSEDGNNKYVNVVDPAEPNRNGRQFNKRIKVTGTDVDYPSKNGTAIREIDAESPDPAVPTQHTTWGRLKGQYR